VANANMERALRRVSIERGHDPADFWLVAFGGAGPLHACELAGRLGMKGVVVPRWPGLFSALGMVLADMTVEKSRTVLGREIPWKALEREARGELRGWAERFVEARYRGQSYEIRIPVTADGFDSPRSVTARFHAAHRKLYGFSREAPVEIVNAVVRVTAELPKPRFERIARGSRSWTGRVSRPDLRAGETVRGPSVISEDNATTYLPRRWTGRVDLYGNIVICK